MRLFIALSLPAALATQLIASMGGVAGARWQSAAQLHLTLAFLGAVEAAHLPDLDAGLSAIVMPPIALSARGVGHFASKGRPHALWAAAEPAEQLAQLAAKVRRAAQMAGVRVDGHDFIPHITLARLPRSAGPIDDFLGPQARLATSAYVIDHFGLFDSHLSAGGAHYRCIREYGRHSNL